MIFEFTITFSVPKDTWNAEEISETIFGSGLNDVLVLTGTRGMVGLDVFRESSSAEHAIESVINDIVKIYPNAVFLDVKPDLVSLADIAKLVGQSRQNLSKLVEFPPPTITGSKPYWHLYQVIKWYETKKSIPFPTNTIETSKAAWMFNLQLEKIRLEEFMEPSTIDISELKGMLTKPGQPSATIEDMNRDIASHVAKTNF